MPAKKYLELNNQHRPAEKAATVQSAGVANAGDLVGLGDDGKLDPTVLPPGLGETVYSVIASEALNAGDFVQIFDDGGTPKARKADATTVGKECFAYVLDNANLAETVNVHYEGVNSALTGLTPGASYYLATTAGAATNTPPSAAGSVVQFLGRAISTSELMFEPDGLGYVRA